MRFVWGKAFILDRMQMSYNYYEELEPTISNLAHFKPNSEIQSCHIQRNAAEQRCGLVI